MGDRLPSICDRDGVGWAGAGTTHLPHFNVEIDRAKLRSPNKFSVESLAVTKWNGRGLGEGYWVTLSQCLIPIQRTCTGYLLLLPGALTNQQSQRHLTLLEHPICHPKRPPSSTSEHSDSLPKGRKILFRSISHQFSIPHKQGKGIQTYLPTRSRFTPIGQLTRDRHLIHWLLP